MNNINVGRPTYRTETIEDQKLIIKCYQDNFNKIKAFPKLPINEIKKWQFKRLKWLVKHSYETLPFYHKKYKENNFHPDKFKTFNDFKKIPVVTKEELIEAWPNNLVSKLHNTEFTTRSSGSSGKFVTVAVDKKAVIFDTIIGIRQLNMQSLNKVNPQDLILQIYTCPWWFNSIGGLYESLFLPTTEPYDKTAQVIYSLKPKVLSLYPSYLKPLSNFITDQDNLKLKLIITHSEQSTLIERERLSEKLGVSILDEYSSEELTRIALECPNHNYHIEEDSCYIEILDENNEIVEQDKKGEVIGTNLLNEATPLIRYRQGDIAKLSNNNICNCGSNFRQISELLGRKGDFFIMPDGKVVAPGTLMDAVYNWFLKYNIPIHGLQYQIIQNRMDDIILNLAGRKLNSNEIILIEKQLKEILGDNINVNINFLEQLENKNWKHKCVISHVNKSGD